MGTWTDGTMLWGKQVTRTANHPKAAALGSKTGRRGLPFWAFAVKFKQEVREAKRKRNSQL